MTGYDLIVLGTGGVGSAAAMHAARRGARVLGLDRFPGGHDRGSSHGDTRIIRQAYFEHPDYVPLLLRAYTLWAELEQLAGRQLFFRTGLLEAGPADGVLVPGVLAAARQHRLNVEELAPAEVRRRFPGFALPEDMPAVFEPDAGYLKVEQCVLAHLTEAAKAGAAFQIGPAVTGWHAGPAGVTVQTTAGTFQAAAAVVTAGAWAGQLLAGLGLPFEVRRKHLHWYANEDERLRQDRGAPVFLYEVPEGFFYGFPQTDFRGVKVAEHTGGDVVGDPLAVDRGIDPADRRRVEQFLTTYLPGVSRRPTDHAVCLYTMTPDENFVVARHPEHAQVAFAAGLSGHGFKFTSVLGEVLADLALEGKTPLPIDFLAPQRFG